MTIATERAFVIFQRGQIRDEILAQFRIGLRALKNPETGVLFTEDETRRAVQQGGRFWREAEAIDLLGQSQQARALWLADQVRMDRASHSWLDTLPSMPRATLRRTLRQGSNELP